MPNGDGVETPDEISLIPEPSAKQLNARQQLDYRSYREELIQWMLTMGKNPDEARGYSLSTVNRRACDTDQFHRYIWEETGRYTTEVSTEHADAWMRDIATNGSSRSDKANKQKSVKMLLRYHGIDGWNPAITYSGRSRQQPPDYLSRNERRLIREASLEFGTVPTPTNLTPEKRTEWKQHLAMRYNKPARKVTHEDFRRANGFKYPSLMWAALDAALRPAEVGRARVSWVDLDNGVLRIPYQDDTKGEEVNRDNWEPALREQTVRFLKQWIEEREMYGKYDDTDRLWLTRHGNPYTWRGLKHILQRCCEIVDIDTTNRKMTFYAIRHSTGTYMAEDKSLEAARVQLRRKTVPSEYDNTPVEERRDALEGME